MVFVHFNTDLPGVKFFPCTGDCLLLDEQCQSCGRSEEEIVEMSKSVDELAQSITMDKYKDWIAYDDWRELNVRGAARYLLESGAVK